MYMYVCIYIYIYMYTYTSLSLYIYIYIHTHTHYNNFNRSAVTASFARKSNLMQPEPSAATRRGATRRYITYYDIR